MRGSPAALIVVLVPLALWVSTTSADVTGVVRELGSNTPIVGARVSLQASGIFTTTQAGGNYTLVISDGTDLVIVGASKGYFNASVLVDAPAVAADIYLDPIGQPDNPEYSIVAPNNCSGCHLNQYLEWFDSPMSLAGLNTWVHDIYNGTGTPGGMGGFVYTRDSIYAGTNSNSECGACHQPEMWVETPFTRMNNPTDPDYPSESAMHGISCEACHKIADVDVSKINYPGIFPGAMTFTRPYYPDQVQYGVQGDTDFFVQEMMMPSYQPQLVAEVCGLCHQDKNDPDEDHSFAGITSEPTYTEWAESPYGDSESPMYATCVDCHMPPTDATAFCNILFPPLVRPVGSIRSHTIEGTTALYLENAVTLTAQTDRIGGTVSVEVTLDNSLTGHHVPTGVTVRNMILLVEVSRDADGQPLTQTGPQTVHDLGGIGDPAQGYYAGLPGKFYAKVNHDASMNSPTFFTDAAGIVFDNRIAALDTDVTNYTFELPPGGGDFTVQARLIYRRAFRFLVDAKQWTEDGHGNPLEDVAAPDYGHLMESASEAVSVQAGDFDGDTLVTLDDHVFFADCLSGPSDVPAPTVPTTQQDCLAIFDLDVEGHVDLADYADLAVAMEAF